MGSKTVTQLGSSGADAYLERLFARLTDRPGPNLSTSYTPLESETPEGQEARERGLSPGTGLLAALDAAPRLLILGKKGQGKSFFLRFLAACLAGERLGSSTLNLERLQEPLFSAESSDEATARSAQTWSHGPLLPVCCSCERFTSALEPNDPEKLWAALLGAASYELGMYAVGLRTHREAQDCILLLDDAELLPGIGSGAAALLERLGRLLPKARLVAAADRDDWLGAGMAAPESFQTVLISPLHPEQVRAFIARRDSGRDQPSAEELDSNRKLRNPLRLARLLDGLASDGPAPKQSAEALSAVAWQATGCGRAGAGPRRVRRRRRCSCRGDTACLR